MKKNRKRFQGGIFNWRTRRLSQYPHESELKTMLKTGIFVLAIGFVLLIFGLAGTSDERIWMLLFSGILIGLGFYLYNRGEKSGTD
ncbi:hypothetical protein [Atopococcus tabaci]|uniref:hypothetical protein n=1 Tax=Atopococcus tabaci TaxID=269774 RepID=UPI0012EC93A1|nr:hypothetical protein [Atopococcus tabaci]